MGPITDSQLTGLDPVANLSGNLVRRRTGQHTHLALLH